MSGSQVFVCIFAVVSVVVSVLAIWRITKAPEATYKPLWIIGSLFGFVGFATSLSTAGDLYLQLGFQIPVLMILTSVAGNTVLKTLFPVIAAVALVKFHPTSGRPEA